MIELVIPASICQSIADRLTDILYQFDREYSSTRELGPVEPRGLPSPASGDQLGRRGLGQAKRSEFTVRAWAPALFGWPIDILFS